MSVRLIAKKRLAFRNPEDQSFHTVMPGVFETCPDWIKKDPMFQWAKQDGSIQVADDAPVVAKPAPKKEEPKEEAVEEVAAPAPKAGKKGKK